MIYAILTILALVGVIGYLWVDNMCLREQLQDVEYDYWDITAELDPVEIYDLRCKEESE